MTNHYAITGPACVSFSGGRTSGYMLRRILDAHKGSLPHDVLVVFSNTGKERPETLDFVRECGDRWGVPIVWLEYAGAKSFRVVDYASASRNGEPFELIIKERGYLPNPITRFCTGELKIKTLHRYLRSIEWVEWINVVGLRADEMHRVTRVLSRKETSSETVRCPLASAGVTKADVDAFWSLQPFDLSLRSWEGNCDLCFLKGEAKRLRIIADRPDLVAWWIDRETERNATFRAHSRPYASLLRATTAQMRLPVILDGAPDDVGDCACTD